MRKIRGIFLLLALVVIITGIIDKAFFSPYNISNILRWTGLFSLLSLGGAFPIITGGIDLSLGSICALIGSLLPLFVGRHNLNPGLAMLICFCISLIIGLIHGLLITRLKIQPFVVTLCGLFIYRGLARFITGDVTQGFGQSELWIKFLARGKIPSGFWGEIEKVPKFIAEWSIPMPFVIMIIIAVILWLVLERSTYGRYIFAIGRNENAARYSGIKTDRIVVIAYILSATIGGLAAMLFVLDINNCQPSSQGIFFELYAIAGAVLGGCSLRGGEGNIAGIILGTAIVRVLYNVINILGVTSQLEYAVVGFVIILGVTIDEVVKRYFKARFIRLHRTK